MTFKETLVYGYYSELKYRLYYSFCTFITTLVILYSYKVELLLLITSYIANYNVNFIYTKPSELLIFYIELTVSISIFVWLIYILFNLLLYITPALYFREFNILLKYIFFTSSYFILSLCIIIKLIVPYVTYYLISINNDTYTLNYVYNVRTTELLSYIIAIIMISLILFYIPVLTYLIFKYLSPNTSFISKFRIYSYIFILLLSAMLSPGEWLIQILMILLLCFLFEFSLVIYIISINI